MTLTVERLKEVLYYDPETGVWTWLKTLSSRGVKGSRAGYVRPDGYRSIRIDGAAYLSHCLAVFYVEDRWPDAQVDHENVTPGDDRWENIRRATPSQNCANSRRSRNNTSGCKGVSWDKKSRKWRAEISVSRSRRIVGMFDDKTKAYEAYCQAASAAFGAFARVA